MAGQVVRQVYDQEAASARARATAQMRLSAMVQRLTFAESHPAARVSELIREGFFSASRALLVPTAVGAVPSTEVSSGWPLPHALTC